MPTQRPGVAIRSFAEGDEELLAALFNRCVARCAGPIRVSGAAWRAQYHRQGWNAPSLGDDADCCRIAEREGVVLGYAITDYQPMGVADGAVVQELCVAQESPDADEVALALIEDAERRAAARGKSVISLALSREDPLAAGAAAALEYHEREDDGQVFMVSVRDLAGFLREIEPELQARLRRSPWRDWRGTITIACGDRRAGLAIEARRLSATAPAERPDIALDVAERSLPLLLFGRETIGELYVQDEATVSAAKVAEALDLLDSLFPTLPMCLPRAQWW